MEQTTAEMGQDIISMVQGFGVFRHDKEKPTSSEIGKALWGNGKQSSDLDTLYNVFAWYALEEIARTWYRYLEDNPVYLLAPTLYRGILILRLTNNSQLCNNEL